MTALSGDAAAPLKGVTGDVLTTCRRCGNSGTGDPSGWHHWRHPYEGPWSRSETPDPPVVGTPLTPAMAHDPVLRLALVNKGLITVADLQAAQAELNAVTGQIQMVIRGGGDDDVPGRSTIGG